MKRSAVRKAVHEWMNGFEALEGLARDFRNAARA